MTGTTLVTAGTVDIVRQVLKFLVLEEMANVLLFSSEPAYTISPRTVCRVVEAPEWTIFPRWAIVGYIH